MRAGTSLLLVSLLVPVAALPAQVPPPIERGTRIRVTAPLVAAEKMVGTYLDSDGTTLRVQAEAQASTIAIPMSYVTRLEVGGSRKSNALKGLVYGSVSGAVLGAVLGFVVGQEDGDNPCGGGRPAECAAIGAAAVGVTGGLVGLGIGALSKSQRWKEVSLGRLRLSFATQRDGTLGFGVSLRS